MEDLEMKRTLKLGLAALVIAVSATSMSATDTFAMTGPGGGYYEPATVTCDPAPPVLSLPFSYGYLYTDSIVAAQPGYASQSVGVNLWLYNLDTKAWQNLGFTKATATASSAIRFSTRFTLPHGNYEVYVYAGWLRGATWNFSLLTKTTSYGLARNAARLTFCAV
jgi:hypothetical protein